MEQYIFYPIQAANTIKKVEGMNRLQSLTTLHLRDNQLESLDGFVEDLKMLQYINFRLLFMTLMILQIEASSSQMRCEMSSLIQ